jgi:hypothetical protein
LLPDPQNGMWRLCVYAFFRCDEAKYSLQSARASDFSL